MNFVYGIICHQLTNPLIFLVNELIKSPHSIIIIHVDKKTDIHTIKSQILEHAQIHFIEDRVDVQWGGYSQIDATLKLLNYAQEFDYKYFSLLSGDDIPLKDVNTIEKFLLESGKEFLGHDKYVDPIPRVKYIYPDFFYERNKSFIKKIACKIVSNLHKLGFLKQNLDQLPILYKGTSWFTLSKEAIQYILRYIEKNPNYDVAFQKSYCGDEVYFHTIIYNSPFKENLNLDYGLTPPEMALRYIDWKTGPDYPRILDDMDFDRMQKSNTLFARKMKKNISFELLKKNF